MDVQTGAARKLYTCDADIVACAHVPPTALRPNPNQATLPSEMLVVSTNKNLMLWENAGNHKTALLKRIATDTPQTAMRFSPEHALLFAGNIAGHVHAWDLDAGKVRWSFPHLHTDCVTAMDLIGGVAQLATGSFDATIRTQDQFSAFWFLVGASAIF